MGRNISVKAVIVVLLLCAVCFLYYRYGLSPQLAGLRDVRDQVATAEVKLTELKEVQRLHDAFIRQNEDYNVWIEKLAQVTPTKFDQHVHTQFLLDLQALGKASGINYTSIEISDASMGQGTSAQQPAEIRLSKVVGVTMDFTAKDYGTVRRFGDALRTKFKYLIVSSEVSLSRTMVVQAGQANPYTCSMTAWMVLSPDATIVGAPAAAVPTPQPEPVQ
jgi:hypothetical protein